MVGIVIVAHSEKLAEGVLDETKIMADGCPVAAAGGTDEGGYGTSCARIERALLSVLGADGAVILTDMGSARMSAEMVMEQLGREDVLLLDCPLVEGAVAASLRSVCGGDLAAVRRDALAAGQGG